MNLMPFEVRFFLPLLYRLSDQLGLLKLRTSFDKLSVEERIEALDRFQNQNRFSRKLLEIIQLPLRVACYSDLEFHEKHNLIVPKAKIVEEAEAWQKNLFIPSLEWSKEPIECDVVVVGSGAGGAVVANTLAEKYHLAVAIVEEGMYWDRKSLQDNSFKMQAKLNRYFGIQRTEGMSPIIIPTGIGVGGTTLINCGSSYRTPATVLKRWRDELNLRDFTNEMLQPHFEKVEKHLRIQPGEKQYLGPIADVIATGADKLGYSHHPIPRSADGCDGQGACSTGCPSGAKRSTNISYIPSALGHGASLFTGYRVVEILQENGQVAGIRAKVPGFDPSWNLEIRAKCVVLATGSLVTPQILMDNNICTRHSQLGKNLSIHPAINIGGLFPNKMQVARYIPQAYAIDHFREEGMLFEGASIPPEFNSISLPVFGKDFLHYMENYDRYASFGFLIRDTNTGSLKLRKGKKPKIFYSMNQEALERQTRGIKILGEVMFAGGAEELLTQVSGRGRIKSLEELYKKYEAPIKPWEVNLSAYHPLGTCRMGSSPENSVISPEQEVWEMKNLFIADGSAVPGPLGVNPQVTIMSLATRVGEIIASRF